MPDLSAVVDRALRARSPAAQPELAHWWSRHRALCARHAGAAPIVRAVAGGADADRAGWAFAAGYQAALRALVPALPDDAIAAFCVTEADGNSPRAIRTVLAPRSGAHGFALSGEKRWSTLGPASSILLIAAREGASAEPAARPVIRLVRVDGAAPGVRFETMPPTPFVPEVPHARLHLDAVAVAGGDVLPGDGYARYVKPFRTLEDIHVSAALLAYLLAQASQRRWPSAWRERAAALLFGFGGLAAADPASAATQVALAGTLAAMQMLTQEVPALWPPGGDEAASRWQRDARLMGIAASVRERRLVRAWERLDVDGPDRD